MAISQKIRSDPIFSRLLRERGELTTGVRKRQEIIKKIQEEKKEEDVKIITYISKYGHPAARIDHNDTKPIDDMLRSIAESQTIELIIHSAGGLAENAKKIVSLIRSNCRNFKVIVPDAAKSAATIIALGSDKIIMSDTSELGPIDPQIPQPTPRGIMMRPAWTIVKSFNSLIKKALREDGSLNPAYIPILSNFDVSLLKYCEVAIENSKKIAEEYLKNGMLKENPGKAGQTAKDLAYAEKYTSHAHLIDYKEAVKLFGGEDVEYIKNTDPLWNLYWELYCRSALFLENPVIVKLFETENNSVNIRIALPQSRR
ncbi:MAG: SDH family Clp fold serine proteinase [Candidatus Nealsonbacteria bacterium]